MRADIKHLGFQDTKKKLSQNALKVILQLSLQSRNMRVRGKHARMATCYLVSVNLKLPPKNEPEKTHLSRTLRGEKQPMTGADWTGIDWTNKNITEQ